MVRLKGLNSDWQDYQTTRFQFQNGTIKSQSAFQGLTLPLHFNSKMVRLKGIAQ